MKPRLSISQGEQIARLGRSGLSVKDWIRPDAELEAPVDPSEDLRARLERIRALRPIKITDMMCFIAYDIESNKVRTKVAKYLIECGCHRVQKSVYFARVSRSKYKEMIEALRVINELYENEDSIFFLPVGEGNMNKLQIVGRDLYIEVARDEHHTILL